MTVEDLILAWRTNDAVTVALLGLCPDETLEFKPGKGKTIRSNFVHIIGIRRAHVETRFRRKAEAIPKLDWQIASRDEILRALAVSRELAEELLRSLDEKPNRWSAPLFLGYAVAHEAHHRSQIEIALRMNGYDPGDAATYGLWDWPKISRGGAPLRAATDEDPTSDTSRTS